MILTCDERSSRGYPSLTAVEECTYLVNWPTQLTCSTKANIPEKSDEPDLQNCILDDKSNGFYFDFNGNDEREFSDAKFDYKFDICEGVSDIPECVGAAFCRREKGTTGWTNVGKVDELEVFNKLELAESIVLEMKFSGGAMCPDFPGRKYSTVIWFSCSMSDDVTKPVVVSHGKIQS